MGQISGLFAVCSLDVRARDIVFESVILVFTS